MTTLIGECGENPLAQHRHDIGCTRHGCAIYMGSDAGDGTVKVCNDPRCIRKGEPQQLKKFPRDKASDDGYAAQCYSCYKRDYNEARKEPPWLPSPDAKLGIMIWTGGAK